MPITRTPSLPADARSVVVPIRVRSATSRTETSSASPPMPSDRFPLTSQHADELTAPSGPERFEFGLALLLEGLAARSSRDWTAPAG